MKNTFILFILLSIPYQALALETRISCATSHHLTTSYALIEQDDKSLELQVMHHNGLKYMPIHQGLITVNDLDLLKKKSELIEKLGTRFTLRFSPSQCQSKDNEWSCSIATQVQLGKVKTESVYFKLFKKRTVFTDSEHSSYVVKFSFIKDSQAHSLPMEYSEKDCSFY